MTDQINPPGEQGNPSPAGEPVNWEARYKGLVPKVDQLTAQVRDLTSQLAGKTSENEQLQAQLGLKDHEKTAAIGERDKQLQETIANKTALEKEIADLRALAMKVEVAKELKRPDLIKVLDTIPNMTDKEALKTVLTNLASFADEAVKAREEQLLSGVVPPTGPGRAAPSLPASETEWDRHIEALPLGSQERAKAMDEYWTWLNTKNNVR